MIARGGSMRPFLPDGTAVMIRPMPERIPRIGEIVLVPRGDDVALHRVIRVRSDTVVTRGDACAQEDPAVLRSDIRGLAVHALRKGRSLPLDGPGMQTLGWLLAKLTPLVWRVRRLLSP